jgi:spore germination protein YaaH
VLNVFQQLLNSTGKEKSIVYLQTEKEHVYSFVDSEHEKHTVLFPTLMSINKRLALARELGVGIQIWEIGQGFECFFQLL